MDWNLWTGFLNVNKVLTIPLVLGAELKCSCGSKHSFLLLEKDDIDINGQSKACVDDCKALTNIRPFGTCSDGAPCRDCMELEAEWENSEPQNELVNGKEIITTKSFLICKAKGGTIEAVTSGQEHGESFIGALQLCAEMEVNYPGLFDQLLDPHGSLYLEEGMYENAIKFLRNYLEEETKNGEAFLPGIYDMKKPKDVLVVAVLDRLLTDCDGSSYDRLINGLENIGAQTGMDQVEGWDVHKLNGKMIDMLEIDCIATAEKINKSFFAKWTEEHKKFVSILGDTVLSLAYAVMIWRCTTASAKTSPVINTGGPGGTATIKSSELVFGSSTKSTQKLMNQMNSRGWTEDLIRNTVDNPYTIRTSVNKATGNSATVFYTQQGSYVIVDDITKAIVQISDNINPSTWVPDLSIVDPYIPN